MKEIKWIQTQKQSEAWQYLTDLTTTELLFGGGAGGAKSFLGCAWLISMCGQYAGTRWVMAREVLKTLKETTLATFFEVCQKWKIKAGKDFKYNSIDGTIIFTNNSKILFKELFNYPSDPDFDSLGSLEITGAFVDEASQISRKAIDVLNSRRRFKLDEYGLIPKTLLTCNPTKKWLYKEFYDPWKKNELPSDKKFIQALAKDNPFISKHYIKNLENIKDQNTKERLLHGNWEYDDDPAKLLEYDDIIDLFTNPVSTAEDELQYLTCDVARFGADSTVITRWQGLKCKKIQRIAKTKTTEVVAELERLCRKFKIQRSHVVVDEDGVGGGVVDQFDGCKGFINNSSPIQPENELLKVNYANLKTQCYFEFAKLAKEAKIKLCCQDETIKEMIVEELQQVKQKDIDKDSKIQLIPKDQIKQNIGRSPDIADALMMRTYFILRQLNIFTPIFL